MNMFSVFILVNDLEKIWFLNMTINNNIIWHHATVTREHRQKQNKQ